MDNLEKQRSLNATSAVFNVVVQERHETQNYPILETLLPENGIEIVVNLLDLPNWYSFNKDQLFPLNESQLSVIESTFDLSFGINRKGFAIRIIDMDKICPYLIHTGYELILMQNRSKPFSVFSELCSNEDDEIMMEKIFDENIDDNIVKHVRIERFKSPVQIKGEKDIVGRRIVFYSAQGEDWRIGAYMLILDQLRFGDWNNNLERMLGTILGYTDAQNDWWIDKSSTR